MRKPKKQNHRLTSWRLKRQNGSLILEGYEGGLWRAALLNKIDLENNRAVSAEAVFELDEMDPGFRSELSAFSKESLEKFAEGSHPRAG